MSINPAHPDTGSKIISPRNLSNKLNMVAVNTVKAVAREAWIPRRGTAQEHLAYLSIPARQNMHDTVLAELYCIKQNGCRRKQMQPACCQNQTALGQATCNCPFLFPLAHVCIQPFMRPTGVAGMSQNQCIKLT